MVVQVLGAFVAVVAVAITMGVPKKFLIYSGVVGGVGWLVELLMESIGVRTTMAMFVATVVVGIISNIFGRCLKAPVTLFLVAGILPLVPGVGMYRIVYYLLEGDNELGGYYGLYTLQIAGYIAFGIFLVDSVFKVIMEHYTKHKIIKQREKEQSAER